MPRIARIAPLILAALLGTQAGAQDEGPRDVGAYLAAREAGFARDFDAAAPFLERLLAARPDDLTVRERLVLARFALGEVARAADLARPLIQAAPENTAARLVLTADGFARGDYPAVLALLADPVPGAPVVDTLAAAWAHLGVGSATQAFAALDMIAGQSGLGPFARYCRALMLALVGDAEGALAIIEDPASDVLPALNRRGMLAYIQLLALAGRFDDALAQIDQEFRTSDDPDIARLRAAFAAGESLPFDLIDSPAQGMAEVYAVMAAGVRQPDQPQDAMLFAQAALAVNPALSDARIILAQILQELGEYDRAASEYHRIGADDPFALAAAMGLSETLEAQEQVDAALAVLQAAEARHPTSLIAPQLLGDALRRAGRHAEAIPAYTRAIEMHQAQGAAIDWRLWFARGVAYERAGQWDPAEADFRAALAVDPDQAIVLNYLGYSLVERREKLDEALVMIERAVALDPDSGFIVDSLAWALFRLGRFAEALPHMERAVELEPKDPILNDHLGDVYWAVGRYREAEFQWRRALSFGPHEDLDMDRVRRKLEVGLYEVMAAEGEPLRPTDD